MEFILAAVHRERLTDAVREICLCHYAGATGA